MYHITQIINELLNLHKQDKFTFFAYTSNIIAIMIFFTFKSITSDITHLCIYQIGCAIFCVLVVIISSTFRITTRKKYCIISAYAIAFMIYLLFAPWGKNISSLFGVGQSIMCGSILMISFVIATISDAAHHVTEKNNKDANTENKKHINNTTINKPVENTMQEDLARNDFYGFVISFIFISILIGIFSEHKGITFSFFIMIYAIIILIYMALIKNK